MTVTRADVCAEARAWLGTKWTHQHRAKGLAVDCAGLIIGVARELRIVAADFDVQGYSRQPDGTLIDQCDHWMRRIAKTAMQPGDVLVLAIEEDPMHMGIVADYRHGGLSLIHASSTAGRVVEHRLMFARNLRFRAAYALPGVT